MKKKNIASKAIEINRKIRRSWDIYPVTKIKEDVRLNSKKRRIKDKKEIKRFDIDGFN